MATNRKSQILEAASELLQCRGFASFSYQDLSNRLGITKAAIHHHFPSKEALGVALAERCYASYVAALDEIECECEGPWDRLDAYVDHASRIMLSGNKICTPGILQAEYNVIPESMRWRIARQCEYVNHWLGAVLAQGRELGVMEFDGEPRDQAALIQAAIQGALQMARAHGPDVFSAVIQQVRQGLRPAEPTGST